MADLKISALTASTTPLAGTEVLPIVQSSTTKQVSVANLTVGRDTTTGRLTAGTGVDALTGNGTGQVILSGAGQTLNTPGKPTLYHKNGVGLGVYSDYAIDFEVNGGTSKVVAGKFTETGNLNVLVGNVVMSTSGKGIDFSATSGAGTSELFSDYEEGTWTAVISDGTNNATMQYTTCQYTKVGRQVTVTGFIGTSSLGSCSGGLRITGLPFAIPNSFQYYSSAMVGRADQLNITAGQAVGVYGEVNGTFLRLQISNSAAGTGNLTDTQWSADGQILLSFTYFTA